MTKIAGIAGISNIHYDTSSVTPCPIAAIAHALSKDVRPSQ